jgi:outer membrane protein assembly factor BamB
LVEDGKVYFGDSCGYLHAYAADGSGAEPTTMTMRARGCGSTGTEISGFPVDVGATLKSSDDAAHTDIFSSPIPHTPTTGPNKGRHMIYVGASSHVDNPCIHGAELAIDASTGVPVWRFDTVPESAIGAGVWSSAAIDAASDLVYIDTGDCVATASAGFAESIVALDASCSGVSLDGSCPDLPSVVYPAAGDTNAVLAKDNPVWAFAAHPNGEEADLDFGSSPNLFVTPAGESLVGAGSKDGSYYAVTAGRAGGRLAWTTRIVDQQTPATTISIGNSIGTPSGGFIGSTGAAYGKIFGTTISGPEFLVALAAGSGALAWDGIDALTSFASVAVANKIVFSADTLGFLRAHDADDGTPLAVANAGGPITSGPVVAHGKVFVGTGFGTVNLGGSGVFAFAP